MNNKAKQSKKKPAVKLAPLALRLLQITEVLDKVLRFNFPADAVLSKWFKENRQLGGRDRGEVAEAVFEVLRHLRRYRHYAESGVGASNRRLAILGMVHTLDKAAVLAVLDAQEKDWLERVLKINDTALEIGRAHV